MQIQIERPNKNFPFAHVKVPATANLDIVSEILVERRITPLAPWTTYGKNGAVEGVTVPVLLEDEHVKPRKTNRRKKS